MTSWTLAELPPILEQETESARSASRHRHIAARAAHAPERSTVVEVGRFGFLLAGGRAVPARLDHLDRQIIALLLKDGRMPCAAMARSIGVSQRTVRYHLERLTHSGVIQSAPS